jgi:phosphate acetyltransferase
MLSSVISIEKCYAVHYHIDDKTGIAMNSKRAIFIAATGQNVGKSTLCLGIIHSLKKRFNKVGFVKPVGQQHVILSSGLAVDKDAILFKEQFHLPTDYADMSPVIIPSGFTRKSLDHQVDSEGLKQKIVESYDRVAAVNDFTVVEGTGHVGVGSIIGLNNAHVAALLDLEMVIIASGGLGSAYDELAMNITMCQAFGARVRGVILNRVLDEKREMLLKYFPEALKKWGIPLVGAVPYNEFLCTPCMRDFGALFRTQLLSGEQFGFRHFKHARLVAGSLESYQDEILPNQLVITPASREDIVIATLETHRNWKGGDHEFEGGLILTGRREPSPEIVAEIRKADLPSLYAPLDSYTAMKKITTFIAKTGKDDTRKIDQAIRLVEDHIDLDALCC